MATRSGLHHALVPACGTLALLLAVPSVAEEPATPAAAQQPAGIRVRLELLGQRLESSISRVSKPAPLLLRPQAPQAIHVSGMGVVLILSARMLPARTPITRVPSPPAAPAPVAPAAAPPAPSAPPPPSVPAPLLSGPEPVEPAVPVKPLEQLERELQRELAVRAQLLRDLDRMRIATEGAAFQRAIDLQMRALHEQAELFRQQAQRAHEQAERAIRSQLKAPLVPTAQGGPPPSESAPWGAWFQAAPESGATEQVMALVREAIVESLPAQARHLRGLDPRESMTVAVDFYGSRPGQMPRARRTLVVRVPIAEIEAVQAGRLTPAEFRARVQAREY